MRALRRGSRSAVMCRALWLSMCVCVYVVSAQRQVTTAFSWRRHAPLPVMTQTPAAVADVTRKPIALRGSDGDVDTMTFEVLQVCLVLTVALYINMHMAWGAVDAAMDTVTI